MRVLNVHQRALNADPGAVGALIASLATPGDRLWPHSVWPKMAFDLQPGVGAQGGHGPIRYFVEACTPGAAIRFRFTGPKGFNGFHEYAVIAAPGEPVVLRHTIRMTTHGLARLSWPLIYRPLHDALLEDSLARAQHSLGLTPEIRAWPPWTRLLRWLVSGGKAPPQGRLFDD